MMSHKLEVVRHKLATMFFSPQGCRTSLSQVMDTCDMICDKGDSYGDRLRARLDIGTGHRSAESRADRRWLLADLLRNHLGGEQGSAGTGQDARPSSTRRCRHSHPAGPPRPIDHRSPAYRRAHRGRRSWSEVVGRTMGQHDLAIREDDLDRLRSTGRFREVTDPRPDILRESCSEGQRGEVRASACTDPGADCPRERAARDEVGGRGGAFAGSTPGNRLPSIEGMSPQGIIETHESFAKDRRNREKRR